MNGGNNGSSQYITNLDPGVLATVQEELARKERQQRRHYFMLSQLQRMAQDLPGKYQQRLPYDLLCGLSNVLLDGQVFGIVRNLKEVQEMEESTLYTQRTALINEHKNAKQEMIKTQKEVIQEVSISRPHQLAYIQVHNEKRWQEMNKRYEEEIRRKDMKIILDMDQKVMEQQSLLERTGIPGFTVTNNPHEVKLQMILLDFITKLSELEFPS